MARLELVTSTGVPGRSFCGQGVSAGGMPLPVDVGEALTAYLTQARPHRVRKVFLAAKARTRPIPPGWSATSPIGPVTAQGCPGSARTGCGIAGNGNAAAGGHDRRGESGAAASGSGHDRDLRQGRLCRSAGSRPALAGSAAMSALSDAARDYLRLRNSLGHELAEYHRELPRFVAVLDTAGLPTVTVAAALSWAQGPDVDPASSVAPRRMTIARGFARYLAGIDARTEVPPPGLVYGRAAGVRRPSIAPTTSRC